MFWTWCVSACTRSPRGRPGQRPRPGPAPRTPSTPPPGITGVGESRRAPPAGRHAVRRPERDGRALIEVAAEEGLRVALLEIRHSCWRWRQDRHPPWPGRRPGSATATDRAGGAGRGCSARTIAARLPGRSWPGAAIDSVLRGSPRSTCTRSWPVAWGCARYTSHVRGARRDEDLPRGRRCPPAGLYDEDVLVLPATVGLCSPTSAPPTWNCCAGARLRSGHY